MNKTRIEAFSDAVIAIIITIMVLELKVPHDTSLHALVELWPVFLSYLLSFIFVGIYWGNHHHLVHTVHHVTGGIIWTNLGLLFCLSLIPFTTGWMGENNFSQIPVAVYAVNLIACAIAYTLLQLCIMSHYKESTPLTRALEKQKKKGMISMIIYATSIITAFVFPWISMLLFLTVSIIWIIPDKNIERALDK